jgi:hypothetical protein
MSYFRVAGEPELTFPVGIHHHQNNSFDEFRERGYARANHGTCGVLRRLRCGVMFVLIRHLQGIRET